MFSYKIYSREDKGNAVMLRLVANRRKAEFSLGFKLAPADLANAQSPNPKPHNLKWKRYFASVTNRIDEVRISLLESGRAKEDVKVVKELVYKALFGLSANSEEGRYGSFYAHFLGFMNSRKSTKTQRTYRSTLALMEKYDPGVAMKRFEDITVDWLKGFHSYLSQNSLKANTCELYLRSVGAVMRDAFRSDLTNAHPFDRFKVHTEETAKRSFSIKTIQKIFRAEVSPTERKYLDFFKLSFMLIGANGADMFGNMNEIEGRIEYRRAKTNKMYSIKIEPEIRELLDRYKGETRLLNMTEGCSSYKHFYSSLMPALKRIGGKMGIPNLTTYWARHTWATLAAELDIPDAVIAEALGHTPAFRTTAVYIRRNPKKVDEANRAVLDWVLYGRR